MKSSDLYLKHGDFCYFKLTRLIAKANYNLLKGKTLIKIFLFVLLSSFSYAIVVLWAFFKEQHTVPCWQGCRGKGLIQHNSKNNIDKLPGQLLAGKDISQGFLCICCFPLLRYFWKTTINSKIKVKSHSFNISFFLKWNFLCPAGSLSYIKFHLLWFTSLLLLPTEALYF